MDGGGSVGGDEEVDGDGRDRVEEEAEEGSEEGSEKSSILEKGDITCSGRRLTITTEHGSLVDEDEEEEEEEEEEEGVVGGEDSVIGL